MKMKLKPEHESVLRGEQGKAMALAMRTLVEYGEAFGAKRLVPITSAHLTGSFGMMPFSAYYDVLDRLASEGAKAKVLTTLNPRPGVKFSIANRVVFGKQLRLERAYGRIGITDNYSCVCYLSRNVPKKGDVVGWAESSAVVFANSVLGARTNRNSILVDICGSVTGLTPEFGYLLDENRKGTVLVKVEVSDFDPPALGFLLGRKVVDGVPVLEHRPFSTIDLKNMGAAMAASGGVALFHVEGVTPEAPDLKTVFDGASPKEMTITRSDLDSIRSNEAGSADMVVFGCPQMIYDEAIALAGWFVGKKTKKRVMFCMVPEDKRRFDGSDMGRVAAAAGVETYDHCPLAALSVRPGVKTVLTNSGKLYYYLSGTIYGTTKDCLHVCGVA